MFNPFPVLTKTFSDMPELLRGRPFEVLDAAAKALHTKGKQSAEDVLKNGTTKPKGPRYGIDSKGNLFDIPYIYEAALLETFEKANPKL